MMSQIVRIPLFPSRFLYLCASRTILLMIKLEINVSIFPIYLSFHLEQVWTSIAPYLTIIFNVHTVNHIPLTTSCSANAIEAENGILQGI